MFDWFEATVGGSKMCYQISVQDLNFAEIPMIFSHTYLGCPQFAVQNLVLIAQDSVKWRPFLKNHIFALFSQSILVILEKLGRDIARGKEHLACEFDFKRP